MNTNIRPDVYESCFVRMCFCSLLCFSFGFYLRFVLVSKNVDVVIQNMTSRPKGFAAVKPTNYIVCMSDCAYVSTCAHSLIHSCNIIWTLLYSYEVNVPLFNKNEFWFQKQYMFSSFKSLSSRWNYSLYNLTLLEN